MIKWNLCVLCGFRNKQQILPYTMLKIGFRNGGGECLLPGTDWVLCYRHFRFKSWYGPAIQVQTLNGFMDTNSFGCKWPNREHRSRCAGHYGNQKLEPGQHIRQLSSW